jgi:hypothetical protein
MALVSETSGLSESIANVRTCDLPIPDATRGM